MNPSPNPPAEPRYRAPSPTENSSIQPPQTVATADVKDVPSLLVHHLEAWMPQKIAEYKLRGFIQDVNGEVMESVPGRIRVRLGGRGTAYEIPGRHTFSWLGLGRRASQIDMELRLHREDHQRDNQLHITVTLKPCVGDLSQDPSFRSVCNKIFCDLRGYLMAQTGTVAPGENGTV
jgi:serine/threonine-protein kinase